METNELIRDEFNTLRDEIKATRARAFILLIIGLFGIPLLTYFAAGAEKPVMLLVPFSVLALIIAYLDELGNTMRAARYIREKIEPNADNALGWEAWLESRPGMRSLEKQFVACLIIILFVYYFLTVGVSMERLISEVRYDSSGLAIYWLGALALIYLVGVAWVVATLLRHWKFSLSTSG